MKWILTSFLISVLTLSARGEVVPAKNAILKSVEWKARPFIKARFDVYFKDLKGKSLDPLGLKIKIDQISKELFNYGYFALSIKSELVGTETEVVVRVTVDTKERFNFQFSGNKIFSHQELRLKLLEKIKNDFGKIDRVGLGNLIKDEYENAGFYNTKISSYQNEGRDQSGETVKSFFFQVVEGEKLKVSNVIFRGNQLFTSSQLNSIYKTNASSLAAAGFYDKNFLENFSDILKKEYLAKGFVFVDISKPRVVTSEEDDSLVIEFGIAEKQQVFVRDIQFKKIGADFQNDLKLILKNKIGQPLDVTELESDLKKIIVYFQARGYYFTTISNLNGESLLSYDKSFNFVDISPEVVLDRQICFNELIVNGNVKTKSDVIFREIELARGELVTPLKLEAIRQRLASLGLFSSLRLSPYMVYEGEGGTCAKTNLVIQVKEKDFGLGEIAPGYRTDLGAKLSTGISYNNLMGMNRSVSFKAQLNQRFNLAGFDDRRKVEDIRRLEYSTKASFVEPYLFYDIFKTQLEFELSSSFQRKRFYGFDADIFRVSPQLSKNFTKNFASSIRYQFERINQFDATILNDNDNFSIGGITPSITFDYRDDPISPRKGSYFTLSSEWANHYFGSMKNTDLEVNYVKLINRNKFYIPMGDFTLAISLALGYEKNFSTEILKDSFGNPLLNSNGAPRTLGYIPSIKVFRLDGYDEIRGFEEGEINRLASGVPIGDVVVQDEAYFAAFKFEPRYSLTDALQIGIFFDAGRVFVNQFKPLDLRCAMGAGLKFLTPVGSLDFDYGLKLNRQTYSDGKRDSVGRFLLSIGFF